MRLSFAHNTLSSQALYSAFRFLLAYFGRWSAIAVAVYKTGRVTVQFECGDRMTVPADKAPTCIRFISPPDTGAPMQLTLPRGNVKVEMTPLPGVFHYYYRDGFRFSYRVPSAQTAMVLYQTVSVVLKASDGSAFKDSFTEAWLVGKGETIIDHNLCARNWRRQLNGSMVVAFVAWASLPPISSEMTMGDSLSRSGYTHRCDSILAAEEPITTRRFKLTWRNKHSSDSPNGHDLHKSPDLIDGAPVIL